MLGFATSFAVLPNWAKSEVTWKKVIPIEEIEGPQKAGGQITINSFKAIEVALPELGRNGVKLDQYRSIGVQETEHSYHVVFTRKELFSTSHGSLPGTPKTLIVRVEKDTFKVTGSSFW